MIIKKVQWKINKKNKNKNKKINPNIKIIVSVHIQ
jgi:hypothetical protein